MQKETELRKLYSTHLPKQLYLLALCEAFEIFSTQEVKEPVKVEFADKKQVVVVPLKVIGQQQQPAVPLKALPAPTPSNYDDFA